MLTVSGSRYEYETNVLSACVRRRIPVIPVPIETIYEDSNKGSHFRPIGDSIRIYVVMLGSFFRFIASSLICTVVDHLLFNLLNLACFSNGTTKEARYIFLSTAAARLVSASLNYVLNRRFVFESRGSIKRSALSYIALCGLIMLLSYLGTWGLSIVGLNSTVSKIISDTALFLVAYVIQERLVFSNSRR